MSVSKILHRELVVVNSSLGVISLMRFLGFSHLTSLLHFKIMFYIKFMFWSFFFFFSHDALDCVLNGV